MKLPGIVKRIGTIEGECRVYVEDYVYTYLNELRIKKDIVPVRAALFGRVQQKEGNCYYFVYGASCVVEELAYGRNESWVREEFFPKYELIGYVNIYGDRQILPDKSKGYFVFYESNEPMQNYLISCYKRENEREQGKTIRSRELSEAKLQPAGTSKLSIIGNVLKKILYSVCIMILTIAVTTINNYDKLYGFMETTQRAVAMMEAE